MQNFLSIINDEYYVTIMALISIYSGILTLFMISFIQYYYPDNCYYYSNNYYYSPYYLYFYYYSPYYYSYYFYDSTYNIHPKIHDYPI